MLTNMLHKGCILIAMCQMSQNYALKTWIWNLNKPSQCHCFPLGRFAKVLQTCRLILQWKSRTIDRRCLQRPLLYYTVHKLVINGAQVLICSCINFVRNMVLEYLDAFTTVDVNTQLENQTCYHFTSHASDVAMCAWENANADTI